MMDNKLVRKKWFPTYYWMAATYFWWMYYENASRAHYEKHYLHLYSESMSKLFGQYWTLFILQPDKTNEKWALLQYTSTKYYPGVGPRRYYLTNKCFANAAKTQLQYEELLGDVAVKYLDGNPTSTKLLDELVELEYRIPSILQRKNNQI